MELTPIYAEDQVPSYTLPDVLQLADGSPVDTTDLWQKQQRPALLQRFADEVYGHTPSTPADLHLETTVDRAMALNGLAWRQQIRLHFRRPDRQVTLALLLYLPAAASGPAPVFLGLNFRGNHSIYADPGIDLAHSWIRNDPTLGISQNRATPASRGVQASRWPVAAILKRGYGVATMYNGDADPDFDDGYQNGIHRLLDPESTPTRSDHSWGTIGAWAWGLSRAMDYLQTDSAVDTKRVAVVGHSRLGKAALWAAAQDERFALVVSNNSGCGGAALSRRRFGERLAHINTRFPHWFCQRFKQYNECEHELPLDQHMLLALIAPRPLYVASASEDLWADPRGEFLAALHASPAYALLGAEGLTAAELPPPQQPVLSRIGYHLRRGRHDITWYDWEQYLTFADQHLY